MSAFRVLFLAGHWMLMLQVCSVHSDVTFLERQEGGSVRLPCEIGLTNSTAIAFRLKRTLLHSKDVLFMFNGEKPVLSTDFTDRAVATGDPGSGFLEVAISDLKPSDTDRYYFEFIIYKQSSEDEVVPGKTEFFLLVGSDTFGSADVDWVEVCAGGSAVLPCPPPLEGGLAKGVILKRQRGRAPAEVLYNSTKRGGGGGSQFHAGRLKLSMSTGTSDITYNLTLLQLQPEDSGLYSCQLPLHGRPDSSAGMGRRVVFVSVQGSKCSCSSYSTLLYALSSAVAVLLLVFILVIYRVRARRNIRSLPPPPIYEEMTGVKPPGQKCAPRLLDDKLYKDWGERRVSAENPYESPSGALRPRAAP